MVHANFSPLEKKIMQFLFNQSLPKEVVATKKSRELKRKNFHLEIAEIKSFPVTP